MESGTSEQESEQVSGLDVTSWCFCSPSVSLQMSVMNKHGLHKNQRELPGHIGTLNCSWTQVKTHGGKVSHLASVEVVWMLKYWKSVPWTLLHPPHPPSLWWHLLDNHSAVSISLTRGRRCILGRGLRRPGSIGKNCNSQLSWLMRLSVALLILLLYHPALQHKNGQSDLGE